MLAGMPFGLTCAGACCVMTLLLGANASVAQTLGVNGDHFTVDGIARFLVFVSYFHGLDRPGPTLSADLDWFTSKGVNGIRVWPNVSRPRLMNEDGDLDAAALAKLRSLATEAADRGMIVDVTFTREHVAGDFTMAEYRQATAAAVNALRDHPNILFDLQNEWNCWADGSGMTSAALSDIWSTVKAAGPAAVVTASNSCHPYPHAGMHAFDVLSYHGPRDPVGTWATETNRLVRDLKAQLAATPRPVRPVYLQEPNRFRYSFDTLGYYDDTASHYWTSAKNAKLAGAAAWTFHTAACFNLSTATPFSSLLLAGERTVLDRLATELAAQPEWGLERPRRPSTPRIVHSP